ncbi:MAG TPA: tetratricopeptide repeat protein [Vicinamibacterales bacterium]|nr:tetratricopeptide repeat protein [Vicinamibacterales bacterium]
MIHAVLAVAVLLGVAAPPLGRAALPARELRGLEALVRAYDAILEARFDQVDAELKKACGPPAASERSAASSKLAPREACDVLAATALWWRIQLDPESRALDPEFSATADRAIAATEAWAERAPDDAEAWFYMGGAYAARVQWRVLRGEKLAAARDGKRILQALERAIELDPALDDAYFGMGMYKYYADVAPAAAKMLRFLLLLPGGDRKEGLEQMLRARARGRLLQGEADYQLSIIYLWYERDTARAIELLRSLHREYPGNPLFLAQIAEIQDTYLHDTTASLATWRTLLAAAREHRANAPALTEAQARLAIARLLDRLHQTDQAIEHLQTIVAQRPAAPFGALPLAYLRLGEAHDRLGQRAQALEAYRSALSLVPAPDVHAIRATATTRMRRGPDPRQAEAYRLSLEGWRRLEQNDLAGASASLERSVALHGNDPVTRYRMGRLLQARKEDAAALVQFEQTIRLARQCPPPVLGTAYLEAARLLERTGRRSEALSYYQIASTLFGASADTHAAAARALTRLRAAGGRAPRD